MSYTNPYHKGTSTGETRILPLMLWYCVMATGDRRCHVKKLRPYPDCSGYKSQWQQNYILTYWATQEDAQNEVNPIADPAAYESGGCGSVCRFRVSFDTHNPAEADVCTDG